MAQSSPPIMFCYHYFTLYRWSHPARPHFRGQNLYPTEGTPLRSEGVIIPMILYANIRSEFLLFLSVDDGVKHISACSLYSTRAVVMSCIYT